MNVNNPWDLTPRQCQVLAAVVSEGSVKGAAALLGLSQQNCSQNIHRAMQRMDVAKTFHALLKWDRWVHDFRRSQRPPDIERINMGLVYRLRAACWRKAA